VKDIYNNIIKSGLLEKLEFIIKQKVENELQSNQNSPFSDPVNQIMQIYQLVMKDKHIKPEMINLLITIFDKSLNNLFGSNSIKLDEKILNA
jgi:hypothetical protein